MVFDNLLCRAKLYKDGSKLNQRPELLTNLAYFRPTLCKDPRDKVFAALEISDETISCPVDYSLPVQIIYTRLAV
jgi:hypothetical protein